ncbi:MAG: hypothetical protein JXQ87_12505 [Bacteroidia bacterium]
MKILSSFFTLILVGSSALAQIPYKPDYSSFDANKLSVFDSKSNYEKYLNQQNLFKNLDKNDFSEFCELTAFTKRNLVTSGQVYQNFY